MLPDQTLFYGNKLQNYVTSLLCLTVDLVWWSLLSPKGPVYFGLRRMCSLISPKLQKVYKAKDMHKQIRPMSVLVKKL